MGIASRALVIIFLALGLYACDATSPGKNEVVVNGRVFLPTPESYEKIWLEHSSIIISKPDISIVYRWIDKKEIEFVGSEKSPYDFFKSVFSNPDSELEKRFLEGFDGNVQYSHSADHTMEFYFLNNAKGQQIYILSPSIDFVVEVATKGDANRYVKSLTKKSYIK